MTVTATRRMKEITTIIAALLFVRQCSSLHVAPPIESCPYDSVLVGDTCKCDPKSCSKPACLYDLNVSVNGTDTPGSCCPLYSCDGCSNDSLIEGKCPCAPDAVLNSRGECQCVDPHKSLVAGECVCDPDRCELPQICDKNHVSVADKDGCCTKTKCIKCPDDSFATNNNDEAVEDKCVCYPCPKDCGPNERMVIIQHGSGFPGNCCDMYKCESDETEKKCINEGAVYGEGESWETADAQTCKCRNGISFCSKSKEDDLFRSCHNEGSVYKHNESWMVDSCTNCTCVHGETKCIAHVCEVAKGYVKKPECHPLNCTKVCPDGYRLNKHGCKICKCNPPFKYDDLLYKYNITKSKLKDILEQYFATKKGESTPTDSITASSTVSATTVITSVATDVREDDYTSAVPKTDSRLVHVILWPSIAVATLLTIVAALLIRKCKSHGSYDTNPATTTIYEQMKLKTDTIFNNNYINKNVKGSV